MIITSTKDGFAIKKGQVTIGLDGGITIGEINISGPGEYDVSQIEVKSKIDGMYFCSIEAINIAFISKLSKVPSGKDIDEDRSIEVVLARLGDEIDLEKLNKTISILEPSYVVVADGGKLEKFCKQEGGCPAPVDKFVLTSKDALGEKQTIIVL